LECLVYTFWYMISAKFEMESFKKQKNDISRTVAQKKKDSKG
jgi:hypothetical protein